MIQKRGFESIGKYPAARIYSDHNYLVCKFEIKLKNFKKKARKETIEMYSDDIIMQQVYEYLSQEMRKINGSLTETRWK